MQNMPKLPFSFQQFVKYPVYAVCFLLMIYFCYKEFFDKSTLQKENDYLRKENAQYKYSQQQLITALLIKNAIIYKQEKEKQERDSTFMEKVGYKAKKIIGGN